MIHAIVLIEVERGAMPTIGGSLADLDGVTEAWSVTGEWDFVAFRPRRAPRAGGRGHHGQLLQLPGVARTHTMVAFEAFSRHDLEALFSIGQ
jgi:DNA-binding Lrp family transcriptional regulator